MNRTVRGLTRGDPDQLLLHHHSGLGIERAERLVHQQHLRLDRIGAGDGDALLHAARKLVRVIVLRPRHSHEREIIPGQLVAPRARHSLAFEPECDVLAHGLPGEERELLEHHSPIGTGTIHAATADPHDPRGRQFEPGRHAQQRRLSATGRTDDGEKLLIGDLEAHVREGRERGAAARENLGDCFEDDVAHGVCPQRRRIRASANRRAISISSPVRPTATIAAMTISGARLLCPCTST